ncbi:YHYH domain-containing protein [Methylibium sp.]
MKKIAAVIGVVLAMFAGYAISHGGGLDKNGCHTDHQNGGYHCH